MRSRRAVVADTLLAAALAVVGVVGSTNADAVAVPDRALDGYGLVLVVVAALALAARRHRPLATLTVVTACTVTYLVVGYAYGPILVSFLVAVYTAARELPLRTSLAAAAVALPAMLAHLLTNSGALPGFVGVVPASAWVVVPFAVGTTVRQYALAADRARAELVREHVTEERLRVAQEVHDVVGHGLAAIKMQADVALHVLERQPEQAARSLTAISGTSAEALDELRSALALVRRDGTERSPGPGLERLDDLRHRTAEAGLEVEVTTIGAAAPLPAQVDLVAYRVVQEALTNVLRHSPARFAAVRVAYETDAVSLTVSSSGVGTAGSGEGLGIPGMRRRVESVGGTFSAGPTPRGRFEVAARLPVAGPV